METMQNSGMRATTELEQEALEFLNDLRESGVTNMYGARPYVKEEFQLDDKESKRLLMLWMDNFNIEGNYQQVKIK
jgi:hypothetical protein